MKYFAKLIVGGTYRTLTNIFELGVEKSVTNEEHNYLSQVIDFKVISEDDKGRHVNSFPLFACRSEEDTVEEKVAEEIKDAPESLHPRRKKDAEQTAQ